MQVRFVLAQARLPRKCTETHCLTLWCETSQGPVGGEQKLTGERNVSIIRNKLFQPADFGNRSRGNEEFQVDGEAVSHWSLNCKTCNIGAELVPKGHWCLELLYWSGTKVSFLLTKKNIGFY